MTYKLGVDVGGTFTDFFLWAADGTMSTYKTLSTPGDPSVGVLDGLSHIADDKGIDVGELAGQITTIVHGTTVTTNATLTRNGAKTGLVTTAGVRDALEMRRGVREEQYNNRQKNVVPLAPRYLRMPVGGRLDYKGLELDGLDLDDVNAAVEVFAEEGVEAVAICFMNSFANQAHEQAAAEIVRAKLPDVFLSVSSEVLPTIRFYNRVSTTVLNSYVGPILRDYLESLTERLSAIGFGGVLLVMQSNGGVALPEVAVTRPAATLLSGPAGGPKAAAAYTRANAGDDCIVVDMGGTSFDASLVRNGEAAMYQESDIDRLRIALPMLAIITIGAGGGSIGWIDEGGLMRMGPQSAGADPGPACYGRGGQKPTCTDANVVLGYLDPGFFAGGAMTLDVDEARKAIEGHVGDPLGVSVEEAAAGMYRVINTNMAHGVREITVERGLDPRDFPIVVAGGAGSLHACMIADELEIPSLLVPPTASVLCAAGMLQSDLQHDFVRSYVTGFSDLDPQRLRHLVASMTEEGDAQLQLEGVDPARVEHRVDLDLRYVKQYHEVTVPVGPDTVAAGDVSTIADSLHREHDRLYGYNLAEEGTEVELINVRVRAIGRTDKPELALLAKGGADPSAALKGARMAYVPELDGFAEVSVYDGHLLLAGNVIGGPALIERTDTTILVSSSFQARIDDHGSCLLTANEV
ncbi:MAG: hydantoinase/oxoprolinase family protein [Actinomycetia bacterium]|nr:hydantoinase/oxoprolinase family protein [Actinomycetes bacterium]MCP4222358.1 hydantoinase/oxoprolinase family protein [Actinomycetes bacterium]MCP5033044.1 hydantoinase/oxoprolinase family protein [Actinomycetes bacterium]